MPSSSRTLATAPMSETVFLRGRVKRSFASLQSGRMELKILLCLTWPAMTACPTPSLCSRSMALESSPRLTQWTRCACLASSGSASSLMAITAISMPWERAPSRTRNGKRPLPAMSPQPVLVVVAVIERVSCLFHDAAFGGLDKLNEFANVFGVGELHAHFGEGLGSVELGTREEAEGTLQSLDAVGGEAFAFEADGVGAEGLGFAI